MIVLVGCGPRSLRRYVGSGLVGQLHTPDGESRTPGRALPLPWACDNGAFTGFNEAKFVRMLASQAEPQQALWVAAPDVVADHKATLELYGLWEPRIREYGYRVALVAQDGLTSAQVPWQRVDCLFVGGSTEFKLGPAARALIGAAQLAGKQVHVGRVNWHSRMRYFNELGADSFDGSCFSRWPNVWLPYAINLLSHPQLQLEEL